MATKPNIPQEEIDLGTLFSQIGKMFSNFFNFFVNIFKTLFHYLIVLLLFIRKNALVLGLATLIGVVVGFLLDLDRKPVYKSEMSVKTNYGSANLLYKQIDIINSMISDGDSTKTAKILKLKLSQASKLQSISIEPSEPEKNALLDYDWYMQNTDTIYTRDFEFKDFLKRMSEVDLKNHKITAFTTLPIELNIDEGIKNMVNSEYYIRLEKDRIEENKLKRGVLVKSINQIDSIRKRYKEVALIRAKKTTDNQANLSLTAEGARPRNHDYDLYTMSFNALKELEILDKRIFDNEEIISILSSLNKSQIEDKLFNKRWLRYGLLGFLLSFLVILSLQFNHYLNKYEKEDL